jgi:Rha family phage regulatory protein
MQLVEVKKQEVLCDSSLVAKKFNQQHKEVVKRIWFLCEELRGVSNPPKMPIKEERVYRGREYTAYLMGREFFSLLVMRFKGRKALEWQVKFNRAFYDMERKLLQETANKGNDVWITARASNKQIRHDTTDVIKEFVDYATAQGSKSAKFYYKHITNATYKALGLITQREPRLRDTLTLMELSHLTTAEYVTQRSIRRHMNDNIPYKKVYDFVKQDLMTFADGLLIPAPLKQLERGKKEVSK